MGAVALFGNRNDNFLLGNSRFGALLAREAAQFAWRTPYACASSSACIVQSGKHPLISPPFPVLLSLYFTRLLLKFVPCINCCCCLARCGEPVSRARVLNFYAALSCAYLFRLKNHEAHSRMCLDLL